MVSSKASSPACYHCGSLKTRTESVYPSGKLAFRCRACGRKFVDPATRVKNIEPPPVGNLILKLRALADSLGRTPGQDEIKRLAKEGRSYRLTDYIKVFGTYTEALKRAGLKANYRRTFNDNEKEMMLVELRQLSRKWGRRLSSDDIRAARRQKLIRPFTHYQKAFGTLANALAAAGVGVKAHWSDEEMIALLQKVDRTLDRPMLKSDLDELFRQGKAPSPKVLLARFGGMKKARIAAGTKQFQFAKGVTGSKQKYSKDELVEQLRSHAERIGRPPTYASIMAAPRSEIATPQTFFKMFGNLREAYILAGFKLKYQGFSRKEIIAALKQLKRNLGHFPTYREIHQANLDGECPSGECIRKYLGGLTELKEWI